MSPSTPMLFSDIALNREEAPHRTAKPVRGASAVDGTTGAHYQIRLAIQC